MLFSDLVKSKIGLFANSQVMRKKQIKMINCLNINHIVVLVKEVFVLF